MINQLNYVAVLNKILHVTMKNVKKINEQQKIIQESLRQYLSKTLIQMVVLLNVAIGLTKTVSSIFYFSFSKYSSNHLKLFDTFEE